MIRIGTLHPTESVPAPADTVGSAIVSSAGAVVTGDWPSGAKLVTFAGEMNFYANLYSTGAAVPSTFSSGSTSSTGRNVLNPTARQIPGGSTGYSITAGSSGIVTLEFYAM